MTNDEERKVSSSKELRPKKTTSSSRSSTEEKPKRPPSIEEEPKELQKFLIKPLYWSYYDEEDEGCSDIYIGGLTPKEEPIQVKVSGYVPSTYLELPIYIGWNSSKCRKLFEHLKELFTNTANPEYHCAPIDYGLFQRYRLHYKKKIYTMSLFFETQRQCTRFAREILKKKMRIYTIGDFNAGELKCHEASIDPVIKFTALNNLNLANWLEIQGEISNFGKDEDEEYTDDEDGVSKTSSVNCIYVSTDTGGIRNAKGMEKVHVRFKYASFDLEVTSRNHNSKLPNADDPHNKIFQAAITFGTLEDPDSMKSYLLSLFDPHDIKGVTVIRCKDENDLVLKFRDLINEHDPDIFIGYNIMKFDWDYMIKRCRDTMGNFNQFCKMSRIFTKPAEIKNKKWSSSAYGTQEFSYLEVPGRMNLDVLCEVERNHKLPKYSLDFVSEHFLKKHKEDVTPRQLFMLYDLTAEFLPKLQSGKVNIVEMERMKRKIPILLPRRKCSGKVATLRKRLLEAKSVKQFLKYVRDGMTITGYYNVVDTLLPIELTEKLNILPGMQALSGVCNVPLSYLHTRGQQIKVLSQVLREALEEDIIIPSDNQSPKDSYEGAVVVEAVPGYYSYVPSLDFNSLYPTVMIVANVCYTTILEDDDPTPDSECHVIPISSHSGCHARGCPLDKRKKKVKEDKIICTEVVYRFRKVKIEIDENGKAIYHNEGLLPRLLRRLLNKRKEVKGELAKAEAKMKMHTGKWKEEEMEDWIKYGYDIIEKGSLTKNQEIMLNVTIVTLNALQLALKVSANSAYGTLGATEGMIPLKPGAATVTALGRKFILEAIRFLKEIIPCTKLIYGDTDSCMPKFVGKNLQESYKLSEEASKRISHHLKCYMMQIPDDYLLKSIDGKERRIGEVSSNKPEFKKLTRDSMIKVLEYEMYPIKLEFENMYGKFLLLTKKRYLTVIMDEKGNETGMIKKGVVLARRDNFQFMRDMYKTLVFDGIMKEKPEKEIMWTLYDSILKMFTRQVPDTHYLIYMGVRDIVTYAKKKEVKNKQGRVISASYIDKDGEIIDEDVKDPLDERLTYPNLPQVLLALKMIGRGDDVPPNTRLEFLYLKNPEAQHLGDSAEDYTYYKENKRTFNYQIDPFIYLNKLTTPIDELIYVRYPREKVQYKKLDDRLKDALNDVGNLSLLLRERIKRVRDYIYRSTDRTPEYTTKYKIGYDALGQQRDYELPEPREYHSKSVRAKCEMIIASSKETKPNNFNEDEHIPLVKVCKEWKARDILNRLYKQFGLRKRPAKKASRSGEKLATNTDVIFLKDFENTNKNTEGKVITVHTVKTENPKKPKYFYDVLIDEANEIVIKQVPRDFLITYYYKDGSIMQDIYKFHSFYHDLIEEFEKSEDTKQRLFYFNKNHCLKKKACKKMKSEEYD